MFDEGWWLYRGTRGQLHILPAHDVIAHEAFASCWCQPTPIDPMEDKDLWVHHSADGREEEESGALKPVTRH